MEYTADSAQDLELILSEPIDFVRSLNGAEKFVGYAAVFYDPSNPGTEYEVRPGFKERIMPGAFDDCDFSKLQLWFEHERSNIMADVRHNSLKISVDTRGLKFEAPYDADDPDHVKALVKLKKKLINGCSFRFNGSPRYHREGDSWVRTFRKINAVGEVSLVNEPCYPATAVALRSKDIDRLNQIAERKERAKILLEKA